MGLTLITSMFGGYDTVRPLPEGHGFDDAILVTDDPSLDVPGWRTVTRPSSGHPRLDAKAPKLTPWRFVDAAESVWIDAACEVAGPSFREWVSAHPPAELRAWKHPEPRMCLFQEALYCQDWPKYRDQPIRQQTDHYRAAGMPDGFGLWACGTLYWRHTSRAQVFGEMWLQEQTRWSIQDQIALPYLLWCQPIDFHAFDGHEYANPHLRWHPHLRDI